MKLTFQPSGKTVEIPDEVDAMAKAAASGMMDPVELSFLAGAALSYQWHSDAIVVEIGAYIGRTSVFLAKVLQLSNVRVPILSIDPFERVPDVFGNPQGHYKEYIANIQAAELDTVCLPLSAFSQDAAPVVPSKAGLLIVDGSHHYEFVSNDLRLYAPKVLPGGMIFIDDYTADYPGVMRAVDEYFGPEQPFEILHKGWFVIAQRRPSV